ncbi:ankyrin repeat domain-containing protein [Piscirickettsia salmonis]|uniref:ankyrin repeat domain-containing protein n=1 Tax=Piscirickettsia salmonis TaxID=1238 RepID=UPI0007C9220E|nr:Ankyrin repeats (3 copies) [Piscirickettsiaceae bacterium NZ-RLO1]
MPRRLTRPTDTKSVSSFLFTAVRSESPERVARIPIYLDSGADPNVRYLLSEISYSSTDAAIKWGSPDIVQLLLNKGGNPYLNTRGVQWPDDNRIKKQMMDVLLEHSQFKMPPDALGRLFFWGIEHNHIDIVQRALEMGADPNEYYYLRGSHHKKSLTPFQLAVKLKIREMIPLLLQYGADFDLKFHEENGKGSLDYARENDGDSQFFDFLLGQHHKHLDSCSQLEAGIGLEQIRDRPLTDVLNHKTVSFLVQEKHHLPFSEFRKQIAASKAENRDQEKEMKQENRRLWSEFCQEMQGRYSDSKAKALASFKECEPTKRAMRGLIATAAQRQQDGQGGTARLDKVYKLLKRDKYHFILDLLGIKRSQLTRDALRSIAVHGEVRRGSMKTYFSANRIKSVVDRNGYYCTMTTFFDSVKEQSHPRFLFQRQYNTIEECSIEPAVEPIL